MVGGCPWVVCSQMTGEQCVRVASECEPPTMGIEVDLVRQRYWWRLVVASTTGNPGVLGSES